MSGAFKRLGFSFRAKSASFVVSPPSYRFDIAIEEDLIEEVARLYGFERIAAHPPKVAATMLRVDERQKAPHPAGAPCGGHLPRGHQLQLRRAALEADFAGEAEPIRSSIPS